MTERRARIQRKREIKKRNTAKWLFRNAVKVLIVALAEIAAAGYVLLMRNDNFVVNGWEIALVYAVGVVTAMMLWGDK